MGRSGESDVRVADAGVSRHHAEIVLDNGACRLRDRASKFGRLVNGARTAEHVLVHDDFTLSGGTFATSRKIPEAVSAAGRQTIVEDLLDAGMAPQHAGTVALGVRHVLCTPLRLVHYGCPSLTSKRVSPRVIRHGTAMLAFLESL